MKSLTKFNFFMVDWFGGMVLSFLKTCWDDGFNINSCICGGCFLAFSVGFLGSASVYLPKV